MSVTNLSCVCGESASKEWATVSEIPIVTCVKCGVRRVRSVDPEQYANLYTSGKYHAEGSDDLPHRDAGREPHVTRFQDDLSVAYKRIEKLNQYKTYIEWHDVSLLDVGCANGAFIEAALDRGFDASGVDLSKDAVKDEHKSRVTVGDLSSIGLQRRTKDVVTFNDSFEHFIDPISALRAARGILKRTGILVIEIPDMGCVDAVLQQAAFKHVKPHEHLWYFTATQLRDLLEREGFTVVGMDVPVSGKVTAYASPSVTVEDVYIYGPPGTGDIIWTLNKLKGIRDKEWPCRIHYVVCVDGDQKMATRSRDFIGMCQWVDSVEFRPIPLPRDAGCPDPGFPNYELIANDYLDPKVPPLVGKYIEDWHPELETDWDTGIDISEAAMEQVINRTKASPFAALYMSSHIWNRAVAQPAWEPANWAELCIRLADAGIKPVILGAGWDANYATDVADQIVALGRDPAKIWINMIGRTSLPLAMAFMCGAVRTVGIAAGLPIIAGYMGWPTTIFWPVRGVSPVRDGFCKEFGDNWVPPHIRESGSYEALTIGKFTVDDLYRTITGERESANTKGI